MPIMKVEIVSISHQLLMSDILDTNAAHVSRSLSQVKIDLTCKVTVGDDLELITDVIQTALRRADIVITIGGLGAGSHDFTRQAVARALKRDFSPEFPGIAGATILGDKNAYMPGVFVHDEQGVLFCLPANRGELAFLLETEVFPYLHQYVRLPQKSAWLLLRTVGTVASTLKEMLTGLAREPHEKVTYDAFAGQANIRLWAQGNSEEEVATRLARLKEEVRGRLGDHVYGEGDERLEEVVLTSLNQSERRLVLVECNTNRLLARAWQRLLTADDRLVYFIATDSDEELAAYLQMPPYTADDDLVRWCRVVAEALLEKTKSDLSLVIFKSVMQGGVQVLVTLASPHGVSVMNRSFGGHPDYIDEWAGTLGLTHLRRWLLVHH
jgi:nicotinamide-nucleotide amidase